MKRICCLFLLAFSQMTYGQNASIPNWFLEDLQYQEGVWITSNAAHTSEQEPFTHYGMEWKAGIGPTSIKGELYGLTSDQKKTVFWEFRQYWDNEQQKAMVNQYGRNNVIGIGEITLLDEQKRESVQTFSLADGRTWVEKHLNIAQKDTFITTSFEQQSDQSWLEKRTYTWIKQAPVDPPLDLGIFSMSLAVQDIQKSKVFYESMGFKVIDGKVAQNWLILKNQNIKIGLFQGMFPKNTLTFNPLEARKFYSLLKEQGVQILFENGMDKTEGPCSFSFLDPDGNPILIDQHQ